LIQVLNTSHSSDLKTQNKTWEDKACRLLLVVKYKKKKGRKEITSKNEECENKNVKAGE